MALPAKCDSRFQTKRARQRMPPTLLSWLPVRRRAGRTRDPGGLLAWRLAERLSHLFVLLGADLSGGQASVKDLTGGGAGGRFALVLAGAPVLHQPDDEREDQPPDHDVSKDHEDPASGVHVVMPEHQSSHFLRL